MNPNVQAAVYGSLSLWLLFRAVANWLTTIHELRRFYTNMWIWDPWDYLSHFAAYRRFDLSVLWIQHNEHRAVVTEVLYMIDTFLFQGRQILPEAAGIAGYAGSLLIMAGFAWFGTDAESKWPALGAVFLTASIAGYKICVVSLNIPFLATWPQWEFFGIAALAAAFLHHRRGGKMFLLAAIFCGAAATYSMANGMLIWPLLIATALLLRFSQRHMIVIAVCGALSIGLYFVHYARLHTMSLTPAIQAPGYLARFLGSLLGLPFSAAYAFPPVISASVCGWAGLAVAAADCVCIIRRKIAAAPPVIVLGGFCLLALASSIMTALARMDPSDPYLVASRAGRYITDPTLFWCALLLLTVWLIGKAWKGYAAFPLLLVGGTLSAHALHRSGDYYHWWSTYFQRGQWAAIGLANGMTDKAVTDVLFPVPEYVAEFKHVLIDNRLAVFADPEPGWIGRQASQIFSRGTDGYIHGEVTTVRKLGRDFEVQGWADGVERVIFTDETGRIVGFGMQPKAGPPELYSDDVAQNIAFAGFIRGEFGARRFSLWAIDHQGRKMYRMGALWTALSY